MEAKVPHSKPIFFEDIKLVVEKNSKKRFALKELDGVMFIRANQGHSIKTIDLGLTSMEPPNILDHGTGKKYLGRS